MTALAVAMRTAGIVPVTDRLREIATGVLKMSIEEWTAAVKPSWDDPAQRTRLLETAMQAVKSNPRNWDGAKDALYKALKNDPELLWALFEPYRVVATQKLLTEAASLLRVPEQQAVVMRLREVQGQIGVEDRSSRARTGMDAVASVARLSLLDTFKINGQPIGDCTPNEANRWAASRARDAAFVRALTANLPSNEPIRKFRKADEAQALYDRAEADHAA